jgi:hypothetical protein
MNPTNFSTRRGFIQTTIQTAGAALSMPLAGAAASAPVSAAKPSDSLTARLAYLEDMDAIRALNREYARHANAGAHEALGALFANPSEAQIDEDVRPVAPDDFGEHDVIDIAPDRQSATALLHCTVHVESAIGPSCPLVDMARQQGGGVVRRTERGAFENVYVRREGIWKIQRCAYRAI